MTAFIGSLRLWKVHLLRCLESHERPGGGSPSGRVELDGMDIYDPAIDVTDLRKRVGMVFKNPIPFLNPSTTTWLTGRVCMGRKINGRSTNGFNTVCKAQAFGMR